MLTVVGIALAAVAAVLLALFLVYRSFVRPPSLEQPESQPPEPSESQQAEPEDEEFNGVRPYLTGERKQDFYTFLLVVLGWVLFEMRENSLAAIGGYFSALFGGNGASFATNGSFYLLLSNLVLFILCAAGAGNWMSRLRSRIEKRNPAVACSGIYLAQLLLFGICICYLVTSTYNPFLYYNI